VSDFALDQNGNTYVTGSGGTVKFGASGTVAWAAPYVGSGIAVDTNGNVYVTGLSDTNFATVRLDSSGANVWLGTFNSHAGQPAASEKVAVDQAGNLYVAGWAGQANAFGPYYYTDSWLVKYDASGDRSWTCEYYPDMAYPGYIHIAGITFDSSQDVYLTGNGHYGADQTAKISPGGEVLWSGFSNRLSGQIAWSDILGPVTAIALDGMGNAYLTGGPYNTAKVGSLAGDVIWLVGYQAQPAIAANNLALDGAADVFVTGVSTTNPATGTDWLTIKYDNDGNQLWVKTYNSPAAGDASPAAIRVAPDGSIYVTGYSANTSGGTDITTIKYVQDPTIQPQPGGTVLLQLPGLPGSSAGLGATTNFIDWTELGPVVAGTNGLYQLIDTNALLFPRRFYRWH
jgi:hypothetical protein